MRDRLAGYAAALAGRGTELQRLPIMEAPNDPQAAVGYADELLSGAPDTTAIIAMSDVSPGSPGTRPTCASTGRRR